LLGERKMMRMLTCALIGLSGLGCSSDSGGDGSDGVAAATALSLDVEAHSLPVGETLALIATAAFDDGTERTVEVAWTSSDDAVAAVSGGTVTAMDVGEATITATYETLTASASVQVTPPPPALEGISVAPSLGMEEGEVSTLVCIGQYADGSEAELANVEWRSSDETVITVEGDQATALGSGRVVLTARFGGFEASVEVSVGCTYPPFPPTLRFGDTFPALRWETAFENGEEGTFSFADFHCDDERWGDAEVAIIVIGAGWCTACTAYTLRLEPQLEALRAAGGVVIFLEAQDANFDPASSEFANDHLTRLIGPEGGIRVGDADTLPRPNFVLNSGVIDAFPRVWVTRRSDMKLIADSSRSQYYLPLMDIVQDPDADSSTPGLPAFRSQCEAGDEEDTEPNNDPDAATAIGPGTYHGGICDEEPDFYQVDIEGDWRFTVEFSHATGDLDVFAWDVGLDQPLGGPGGPVGSQSSDDDETFTHSGPALVRVYGYQGASAPYDIILEAL